MYHAILAWGRRFCAATSLLAARRTGPRGELGHIDVKGYLCCKFSRVGISFCEIDRASVVDVRDSREAGVSVPLRPRKNVLRRSAPTAGALHSRFWKNGRCSALLRTSKPRLRRTKTR